jgi:hypothetical protein
VIETAAGSQRPLGPELPASPFPSGLDAANKEYAKRPVVSAKGGTSRPTVGRVPITRLSEDVVRRAHPGVGLSRDHVRIVHAHRYHRRVERVFISSWVKGHGKIA